MSLVSARGFIGGVKEYTYRGIQQLPIVLAVTSFIFTIGTGSIAHTNLALGFGIIMPIYTTLMQMIFGYAMPKINPTWDSWKRSTGDTCDLVPSHDHKPLAYYKSDTNVNLEPIPSYWLMSIAFFIGFSLSNAIDSLTSPVAPNSDMTHIEKRNTQAIFLIIAICIFFAIVLGVRFTYMRGCEGRGTLGIVLSLISAFGASSIGYQIYKLSRSCGARSSDLFGVLSQMLPQLPSKPNPIVCTAN